MTSGPIGLDLAEVSKANAPQLQDVPAAPGEFSEKQDKELNVPGDESSQSASDFVHDDGIEYPTAEEVDTLRRVAGNIPWSSFTIAFVELCERFAYYGTTVVCELQMGATS